MEERNLGAGPAGYPREPAFNSAVVRKKMVGHIPSCDSTLGSHDQIARICPASYGTRIMDEERLVNGATRGGRVVTTTISRIMNDQAQLAGSMSPDNHQHLFVGTSYAFNVSMSETFGRTWVDTTVRNGSTRLVRLGPPRYWMDRGDWT